jgi:hypothetical protein
MKKEEPTESLITLLQEEINECAESIQRRMEKALAEHGPCRNERDVDRLWSLPTNEKEKSEIRSLRWIKDKDSMIKMLMTPADDGDERDYVLPDLPELRVVTRAQHEGRGGPMAMVPGVPFGQMPFNWQPLHLLFNPNLASTSAPHRIPPPPPPRIPPPPPPRGPPKEGAGTRDATPAVPGSLPYAANMASQPPGLGFPQPVQQGPHQPPRGLPMYVHT